MKLSDDVPCVTRAALDHTKKLSRVKLIEVFTNSLQYKNANIADFVLDEPLKFNQSNEVCNLEIEYYYTSCYLISNLLTSYGPGEEENWNKNCIPVGCIPPAC